MRKTGITHKRPINMTDDEARYFEKTPKHVLFAICKDYAMRNMGESESFENPSLVLKDIMETHQILKDNRLLP